MPSQSDELAQALGRRVTARREAAGLRMADLARLAQISDAYVNQIEAGIRLPTLSVVHRLAVALGCRVSDLIDDDTVEAVS